MLFLSEACQTSSFLKIIYFIRELIKLTCIILPIGLIVMISLDFAENVISKQDEMNKNLKIAIQRILYCLIVFLIPSIVNLSVGILNSAGFEVNYNECLNNANIETIKDFEADEKELNEEDYEVEAPKDPQSNRTIIAKNGTSNNSEDTSNSNNNDTNTTNTNSSNTTSGAAKILNTAEKTYKQMEKDGDWTYGHGHHKITCCIFVSNILKQTGYLKSGNICHYGKNGKPSNYKRLQNVDIYSGKSISDLKPGDVALYQNGHGSGNIGIFSHQINGKYYFYQANSAKTVEAKNHPTSHTSYWKDKNGSIIIIRAK